MPPFLIIFGTFGNILSIYVLTRKNFRKTTYSVYLVVLACSDLMVLYTGLLRVWIIAISNTDIRTLNSTICKLHTWIVYLSLDFSAWILVAVTAERVSLVWFPHTAKSKCTKKCAAFIIASIGLFLMVINGHILYGMDRLKTDGNSTVSKCDYVNSDYGSFFDEIWPWVDLSIFSGLPFGCLLIGNILIITKVFSSQRAARRQIAPQGSNGRTTQRSQVASMSIMLFTINCVFLVCTTPVSVYLIGYVHWIRMATEFDKTRLELVWTVVNLLMYANNTFNFLLYCMSGSRFRTEVKTMFRKVFCTNRNNNTKPGNTRRRNERTDGDGPNEGHKVTAGNNHVLTVSRPHAANSRSPFESRTRPSDATTTV